MAESLTCVFHRGRGRRNLNRTPAINRLPVEILQEIFMHCRTHDRRPSRKLAPLLLCQICSRWREVALSIPRLWNRLSLDGNQYNVLRAMVTFINATALWFACVGRHCPLSYSIHIHHEATTQFPGWNFLFPLPPFIRELDLEMADDSQLTMYSGLQKDALEFLEAARICVHSENPLSIVARRFPFSSAPRLRSLALDITWSSDPFEPHFPQMPWGQLTCLILTRGVPLDEWHEIIRLSPLLQRCYAQIEIHMEEESLDVGSVTKATLNHLEDLTLLFYMWPALDETLAGLHLPALKSLHLGCHDEVDFELTSEHVLPIFQNTQLTAFTLQQGLFEPDLFRIPVIMDAVTTLDIAGDMLYTDLVNLLHHNADANPVVFPRLQHLRLGILDYHYNADPWSFPSELLHNALASRWWPDGGVSGEYASGTTPPGALSRLEDVSIFVDEKHPDTLDEVVQALKPLQAQGLDIDVRSGTRYDWMYPQDKRGQWRIDV